MPPRARLSESQCNALERHPWQNPASGRCLNASIRTGLATAFRKQCKTDHDVYVVPTTYEMLKNEVEILQQTISRESQKHARTQARLASLEAEIATLRGFLTDIAGRSSSSRKTRSR